MRVCACVGVCVDSANQTCPYTHKHTNAHTQTHKHTHTQTNAHTHATLSSSLFFSFPSFTRCRRALGGEIFGSAAQRERLNVTVWPAIATLAVEEMAACVATQVCE